MNEADEKALSDWYQDHMRGVAALSDEQLQLMIRLLDGDIQETCMILEICREKPIGDMRLLPYFEAYLEDRRPCILGAPTEYGEVRWLAAEALAAERQELGIGEYVMLKGAVRPLGIVELYRLAQSAGIDTSLEPLEVLSLLIEQGSAPTVNKAFPFPARLRKKDK